MPLEHIKQAVIQSIPTATSLDEALVEISDRGKMGVGRREDGIYHAIMPCPAMHADDERHGFGETRELAMMHCAYDALQKMESQQLAPAMA